MQIEHMSKHNFVLPSNLNMNTNLRLTNKKQKVR